MHQDYAADKMWTPSRSLVTAGKDEMNLAEFPIATLRGRGDSRREIVYHGEIVDRVTGIRMGQAWRVTGDSLLGLPNEFDERVYVALMAITARSDFTGRRVAFSVYQILKIMGQAAQEPARKPTMQQVLDASKPSDWRMPDPENTLYMELPGGRVVIELATQFAPLHAENIRTLVRWIFSLL
jgi:hypothetical protein